MTVRSAERHQFLIDTITTAVEGGIGYWSLVDEYRWDTTVHSAEDIGVTVYQEDPDEGETDEDGYAVKGVRITPDDIAKTLNTITATVCQEGVRFGLNQYLRKTIADINRTNNGESGVMLGEDMDAAIADCVMQVAVLGECIYG